MIRSLGLLLGCGALVASAGVPDLAAQSSVWKVTREGGSIYLGGTVHALRKQDFPLPPEFEVGFSRADELWFEMDLAEMQSPAGLGVLLRHGVLPAGQTLESLITPEAWQALADYCRESGLSLATMGRFKPGMLTLNIQLFEATKVGLHQQGVELFYMQQAIRAGKTMHGLETVAEQLGFIEVLGAENPSELILHTIRDVPRTGAVLEVAIEAWRRGDLVGLENGVLKEMENEAPEVAAILIVQRNRNWLPRILEMFASPPVEFVLVGAGHLPGPNGLIALLKEEGCTVEQIVAEPE